MKLFSDKPKPMGPVDGCLKLAITFAQAHGATKIIFGEPPADGCPRTPSQARMEVPIPWADEDMLRFSGDRATYEHKWAPGRSYPNIPIWMKTDQGYEERPAVHGVLWLPMLTMLDEWNGRLLYHNGEIEDCPDEFKTADDSAFMSCFIYESSKDRRSRVSLGMESNYCFSLTLNPLPPA